MKIGVNGRFLTKPFTGIGQYTRYLFETLARQNPAHHFLIVVPVKIRANFTKNVEVVILPERFPGSAGMKKTFWEQAQVPWLFRQRKVDLAHFPYPSNPWWSSKKPTIVTVHDDIPWTLPAYRRSFVTRLYQDQCRNALKMAGHILTVSKASKADIIKICKLAAKKITVVPNAPAPLFTIQASPPQKKDILKKYNIDERKPFFLYIGGYDERKNVPLLVETFLKRIAPFFEADLVLAGGKAVNDPLYKSFDELTTRQNGASLVARKGKIVVTGFVVEEDLPALYQSSCALVNLSKKEGFNLPLVEALVSRVPVIASDLPVHREVADRFALFCDADDGQTLAEIMKKLLSDQLFYQKQKQNVESFVNPYSWEQAAKKVMTLYNRCT